MSDLPHDIWKDPQIKAALKDGRDANDIAVSDLQAILVRLSAMELRILALEKGQMDAPVFRGAAAHLGERIKKLRGRKFIDVNTEHDRNLAYEAAKQSGTRIVTRKLNGSGWRIWRVK